MNYSYTLLQTIAFQQRCSFGQFQRSQLFVQSLPAKLIKFDFSGEIAPHHVFHFFADRWFEEIPVDSGKRIHLVIVDVSGSSEKSGYIIFQYRESAIYVLEYTNHCVMFLHCHFCSFQGTHRVERGAFLAVAAEKKRLPAMITDSLVNLTLEVSAFTVRLKYTGLEVLLQPVRIRQW